MNYDFLNGYTIPTMASHDVAAVHSIPSMPSISTNTWQLHNVDATVAATATAAPIYSYSTEMLTAPDSLLQSSTATSPNNRFIPPGKLPLHKGCDIFI